jgi:hypothetical protein
VTCIGKLVGSSERFFDEDRIRLVLKDKVKVGCPTKLLCEKAD